MENDAVVITPWAEYTIGLRQIRNGSRGYQSQPLPGVDWDGVLELSPETEVLRRIISSDKNGHILRVDDYRDLQELTNLLLGKPLLMRVTLVHTEVASKYSADTVSIWEEHYVRSTAKVTYGRGKLRKKEKPGGELKMRDRRKAFTGTEGRTPPVQSGNQRESQADVRVLAGETCTPARAARGVGDYAVVINTSHSSVRSQMKKVLDEAAVYIDTGWRFCLEIDLSDVIEGWYLQTIDVYTGCDDFQTTRCRRSRIYITNHNTYNHCFDCSPRWWLCFSPCWLMTAPCYICYRRLTCKDIRMKLNAKVRSIKCLRRASSTSDTKSKASTIVNYKMEEDSSSVSALKGHFRSEDVSYGTL